MKNETKNPLNFLEDFEDDSAKLYKSDGSELDDNARNDAARNLMRMDLEEIVNLPSGAGIRLFREMFGFTGCIFSEDMGRNPETDARRGMRIMALKYFNLLSESEQHNQLFAKIGPPYFIHPYFIPDRTDHANDYLDAIGKARMKMNISKIGTPKAS